jgi:hypothetical protein
MGWGEFLIRAFGWLAALAVFLGVKAIWQAWTAKRNK